MMEYSRKTKNKLNELEKLITKELKDRIKSLDLIDTGLMYNTTEARVKFTDDGLDIEIETTDYYKYLNSDFNIENYVMGLNNVSVLMDEVFSLMIDDILFED